MNDDYFDDRVVQARRARDAVLRLRARLVALSPDQLVDLCLGQLIKPDVVASPEPARAPDRMTRTDAEVMELSSVCRFISRRVDDINPNDPYGQVAWDVLNDLVRDLRARVHHEPYREHRAPIAAPADFEVVSKDGNGVAVRTQAAQPDSAPEPTPAPDPDKAPLYKPADLFTDVFGPPRPPSRYVHARVTPEECMQTIMQVREVLKDGDAHDTLTIEAELRARGWQGTEHTLRKALFTYRHELNVRGEGGQAIWSLKPRPIDAGQST